MLSAMRPLRGENEEMCGGPPPAARRYVVSLTVAINVR